MNYKKIIRNISIAIFISSNAIAYSIGIYEVNKIIYLFSFFLMLSTTSKVSFSIKQIVFFLIPLVYFFAYFISYNEYLAVKGYFIYYVLFYLFAFIAMGEDICFDKIFNIMSWVLFLLIPFSYGNFFKVNDIGTLLGISYALLPLYISSLIKLEKSNDMISKIVPFINLLVFGYFYVEKGNRGVILCIVLFVCLFEVLKNKRQPKHIILVLSLIMCISLIVKINMSAIIVGLYNFFGYLNINLYFLDKSVMLIETGANLDSGRAFLINNGLDTIVNLQDILFGKGIGFYENEYNIYIHNIFIQYFIEGGLLYLSSFLLIFYLLFRSIILKHPKEIYIFFLTVSFIPLLLSNVYWLNPLYWLSVNYLLKMHSKKIIRIEK